MNLRVLFSSHGWIACFQNEVSSRDKHTSLIPHWGSQAVISLANLTGSFLSCYAFTFFFLQTCPYISEMMALHEDKSLVCSQGRLAHNMYRERFQFATSYLVVLGSLLGYADGLFSVMIGIFSSSTPQQLKKKKKQKH